MTTRVFGECPQRLLVKVSVLEPAVEELTESVLLGTAWIDVDSSDLALI